MDPQAEGNIQMNNITGNSGSVRVSVIVPCYNYGHFLAETLDSVLKQTITDWECIIIDNGSTDNTKEVAGRFVNADKRFRYFYIEQSGVSAARNYAVARSQGRYILPLDADDRIDPTYLQKASGVLEKNVNIKVVYCDARLFGAANGKWILPEYSFRELLIENLIFCSAVYRREDFEMAGGYNENMKDGFEDWDFWISFLRRGGEVYKIPEPLFYYRIRHGSRNNSLTAEKQLGLRRQVFEHHKDLYKEYFLLPDLIFDYYQVKKQARSLKNSGSYRVGTFVLSPLHLLKKLVSRKDG